MSSVSYVSQSEHESQTVLSSPGRRVLGTRIKIFESSAGFSRQHEEETINSKLILYDKLYVLFV
jgi:hypothetical protein